MERINPEFLEKLIIKSAYEYKHFLVVISKAFEPEYFDSYIAGKIFDFTRKHLEEYSSIPDRNVVIQSLGEDSRDTAKDFFQELDSTEFDISANYDWLLEETNEFLKDKALKHAIMQSIKIIDKDDEREKVREHIESALCKDIKIDLGLNYWEELGVRLKRILTSTDMRIPTGFGQFDEFINGGFPALSLSFLIAEVHGGKTNTIINFAARQTARGFTPVILTLEMSEDAYAQRFDSIYSLSDMNRMYLSSENIKELARKLKTVKDTNGHGTLLIKQFPTGAASVRDFRIYLRELLIRDIKFDIIYVDYINLMMSAYKKGEGNLYITVKTIAEELRALSFEFKVPIVSVSQLNREGSFVDFNELNFNYIAECLNLDTKVIKENGEVINICDLKVNDKIKGSNGYVMVKRIWPKKHKKKYKIKTKSGKEIVCSADHKFPTDKGAMSLNMGLKIGDKLNTIKFIEDNIDDYNDEITEIEELDFGEMLDIEVDNNNLFYANNILTKNSKGVVATCDFMAILGTSEEDLIYQSEVHYKIVKNRFGGRVGEVGKFYYDSRSLKMYDMVEEDLWIADSQTTGDERERQPEPEQRQRRR